MKYFTSVAPSKTDLKRLSEKLLIRASIQIFHVFFPKKL